MFDITKTLESMNNFNNAMSDYAVEHIGDQQVENLNNLSTDMFVDVAKLIADIQEIQEIMLKNL